MVTRTRLGMEVDLDDPSNLSRVMHDLFTIAKNA